MAEDGRLKDAFEKFIRAVVPQIDFCALYPGTIIAQNGQLFDFNPDSGKVPGLQGLPFYSGTPGVTITVDVTQQPRAVLFFEGFNPAAPKLAFFGNPGLATFQIQAETSIDMTAPSINLAQGSKGAARVGDPVTIALSDLEQFVFTAPSGGGPCVVTGAIVGPPATQITTGSTKVVIG